MYKKLSVVGLAFVAAALVACGGGLQQNAAGNGSSYGLPSIDGDLAVTAAVPAHSIGEELPSEGLGRIEADSYRATVGGYTQMSRSQVLAFPPGTTITIRNLSKTLQHTLDVVKVITGHVADFPRVNPTFVAHGDGKLDAGYASGIINPGKSVTVHLDKEGTYLIGCAFHYNDTASPMRDILVVSKHAKPGPQATADPAEADPSSSPTTMPTYGSGGGW
jgi:plastocyanin